MYEGIELHVFVQNGCPACHEQIEIIDNWNCPVPVTYITSDDASDRAGVKATPTHILLKDNVEVARQEGNLSTVGLLGFLARR